MEACCGPDALNGVPDDDCAWTAAASRTELVNHIQKLQQENKQLHSKVTALEAKDSDRLKLSSLPPLAAGVNASITQRRPSPEVAPEPQVSPAAGFKPLHHPRSSASSATCSQPSSRSSTPSVRSQTPVSYLHPADALAVHLPFRKHSGERYGRTGFPMRRAGSSEAVQTQQDLDRRERNSSHRARTGSMSNAALRTLHKRQHHDDKQRLHHPHHHRHQQQRIELSQDLLDQVQHSMLKRFADPRYDRAARVLQSHWRQYTLNKKFHQMKRKALRKSMQQRLRQMESSPSRKKASMDLEQRREQLMLLQAAKAFVGDDASGFRNTTYPWMAPQPETYSSEKLTRLCRLGVFQFNRNVRRGLAWLLDNGVIEHNPKDLAHFLRHERSLNRRRIGEFLGSAEPFVLDVLVEYVASFDFTGVTFAKALRMFLGSFHLPGEAQKIERILQEFSQQYHRCNPATFAHADTSFILAFSVVMLNTDLHNCANRRKMTREAFVRNNRGIDDGNDLPRELLAEIYDHIEENELHTDTDNTTMIEKIVGQLSGKSLMDLSAPHRQFVSQCNVTTVEGFTRPRNKQVAKHRVLFLFNDLLIVTKKHKQKYTPKCVLPLYGLKVAYTNSPTFEGGLHLVNKRGNGSVVLSFRIDNVERSTMAKNFEIDLREMIWQSGAVETENVSDLTLMGPGPVGELSLRLEHSQLSVESSHLRRSSVCSAGSSDRLSVVSSDSTSSRNRRFSLRSRKKQQRADVRKVMQMLDAPSHTSSTI